MGFQWDSKNSKGTSKGLQSAPKGILKGQEEEEEGLQRARKGTAWGMNLRTMWNELTGASGTKKLGLLRVLRLLS